MKHLFPLTILAGAIVLSGCGATPTLPQTQPSACTLDLTHTGTHYAYEYDTNTHRLFVQIAPLCTHLESDILNLIGITPEEYKTYGSGSFNHKELPWLLDELNAGLTISGASISITSPNDEADLHNYITFDTKNEDQTVLDVARSQFGSGGDCLWTILPNDDHMIRLYQPTETKSGSCLLYPHTMDTFGTVNYHIWGESSIAPTRYFIKKIDPSGAVTIHDTLTVHLLP